MFIFIITHCNVQVEQINTHPCKMTLVTLRAAQSKLLKVREVFIQDNLFFKFIGNKPCDKVLGAAQFTDRTMSKVVKSCHRLSKVVISLCECFKSHKVKYKTLGLFI